MSDHADNSPESLRLAISVLQDRLDALTATPPSAPVGEVTVTDEMVERAALSFITEMSSAMNPRNCLRPAPVPKPDAAEMGILRNVMRSALTAALRQSPPPITEEHKP